MLRNKTLTVLFALLLIIALSVAFHPRTEVARYAKIASGDTRIDLNKADLETLLLLPGIGETTAQAILDYRAENGFFASTEELLRVPGVGQGRYETIKDLVLAQAPVR